MGPSKTGIPGEHLAGWRLFCYTLIFEADTRDGRLFDQALILIILGRVLVVMADSVQPIHLAHQPLLTLAEWFFTLVFTLEYLARLACVRHPWAYARSFYGVVDLLVPEVGVLIDVRVLRLLRVFRIFKLTAYITEYQAIGQALRASSRKIAVFLAAVLMIVPGWGTLAVSTGIVTAEMRYARRCPTMPMSTASDRAVR